MTNKILFQKLKDAHNSKLSLLSGNSGFPYKTELELFNIYLLFISKIEMKLFESKEGREMLFVFYKSR